MLLTDIARLFVFALAIILAIVFATIFQDHIEKKKMRGRHEARRRAAHTKSQSEDWFFDNVQECRNDFG